MPGDGCSGRRRPTYLLGVVRQPEVFELVVADGLCVPAGCLRPVVIAPIREQLPEPPKQHEAIQRDAMAPQHGVVDLILRPKIQSAVATHSPHMARAGMQLQERQCTGVRQRMSGTGICSLFRSRPTSTDPSRQPKAKSLKTSDRAVAHIPSVCGQSNIS